MNKTYRKNISRTIGQSMGRYLAIMAIIALGVGFFSGLKVTKPGMVQTGNTYYKEQVLYDYMLLSTLGFEENDVEKMKEKDYVKAANGSYSVDFIYLWEDDESVIKAMSITEDVNKLNVRDGRLPEKADECVLDAGVFTDKMIGEKVIIGNENTKETKDSFAYKSYEVVGLVDTPLYISIERGTTSLGSGKVGGFMFLPEDGFDLDYYTELYIQTQDSYDIYTDEYKDYIEDLKPQVEEDIQAIAMSRYDDIQTEIDEEYQSAVDEIEDKVREKIEEEVVAQYKEQIDAQLAAMGMSVEMIEAAYESGQVEIPMDEVLSIVDEQAPDAIKELVDEIELPEIDEPDTYVLDRTTNIGYMCYDNDTNIVEGVAKVFPIFFFLIAALVCSTTMTRMVDDERGQIGTFRALGYSNGAIMSKYLIYSGSSALIGCVAGFFGGTYAFPTVIAAAYKMLYDFGSGLEYYFDPKLLTICIIVSLLCSMGTAYLACKNELRCMPADLIRPKAPAAGKRIFLEYITFLWKKMKFLHKVTARNVFRFKKRMFMMILGIAGCTALVLTGLGVKDSVSNLAEFQFGEINVYDIEVTLKKTYSDSLQKEIDKELGEQIKEQMVCQKVAAEYHTDTAVKNIYLVAAEENDLKPFMNFQMLKGTKSYPELGEVFLSRKIAELAKVKVGDEIVLTDPDKGDITFTVAGVFENYVWHYAYMTPETYEKYVGKEYKPNTMYVNVTQESKSYETGAKLVKMDDVLNVSVISELKSRVENMMKMLNSVVWLVIGSAGALAFIVLFNLSNINITERVREIATIKVLGFYSGETGAYVFRENMVLTLMGIVVGLPLGVWLHAFVMSQIQVDMVSFKAAVFPLSYVICVILVLIFLKVVDLVMRRKIEAIDMAESLKSIE